MPFSDNTFPQDIWAEILAFCPQQSLVVLARVSPFLRTQAHTLLLRTVGTKHSIDHNEDFLGIIYNLPVFYQVLTRDDIDWKRLIRVIRLDWLDEPVEEGGKDVLVGKKRPIADHLVFKIALLLSECTRLREFHLNLSSLANVTAMLKDDLPPITSLEFSLPHRYAWEDIYRAFELPVIKRLVMRNILSPDRPAFRFPVPIPDALHDKHDISNVQELYLLESGPLIQAMSPLFRWPKKLKKLDYSPCEPYWRGILRRTGDISDAVDAAIDVLAPLRLSLQVLKFDLGLGRHWILPFRTGELFQPFVNLSSLDVPVELLLHSRGLSQSRLCYPFYIGLPNSLRQLTLRFTILTSWHPRPSQLDLDADNCLASDPAHRLFDELSMIAMQKEEHFPGLRELTLLADGEKPFLVRCDHVVQSLTDLESSGIHVVQSDWCRRPEEMWI
ncbi:hypothetical protein E4T38_08636 [Aureobasidium subglaciale]|nr:hypothetical protein E4T38_08636 [Aureobasidium subglaciale]KAI5215034.1 hypothetical protein E4T40_08649 [Aureobasidium subglaciale]KAI5218170.1 hypothetical protein E4T41_08503 [Aureobasidium subglaciale]KAI5255890.1 hypothetical protein E4T46_08537 [Aureobasidium subglaciale]